MVHLFALISESLKKFIFKHNLNTHFFNLLLFREPSHSNPSLFNWHKLTCFIMFPSTCSQQFFLLQSNFWRHFNIFSRASFQFFLKNAQLSTRSLPTHAYILWYVHIKTITSPDHITLISIEPMYIYICYDMFTSILLLQIFSLNFHSISPISQKKNRKPGVPTSQRSKSLNKFILFRIHGTIPAIGPPVRAPGHGWSAGLSPKIEDTQRAQHNLGGDHSYVGMDQYLWKYHF